jgi:hypothetical protein
MNDDESKYMGCAYPPIHWDRGDELRACADANASSHASAPNGDARATPAAHSYKAATYANACAADGNAGSQG